MLKYVNHDIVFQEFPDEVTLAINLSLCPCACPGCHSTYLWGDHGEELTEERLLALVTEYGNTITCIGLMGGDNDPRRVLALLHSVKKVFPNLRTGWYSGRDALPADFSPQMAPDYVKIGRWDWQLGPLSSTTTNQRMYRFDAEGKKIDITHRFWQKP